MHITLQNSAGREFSHTSGTLMFMWLSKPCIMVTLHPPSKTQCVDVQLCYLGELTHSDTSGKDAVKRLPCQAATPALASSGRSRGTCECRKPAVAGSAVWRTHPANACSRHGLSAPTCQDKLDDRQACAQTGLYRLRSSNGVRLPACQLSVSMQGGSQGTCCMHTCQLSVSL